MQRPSAEFSHSAPIVVFGQPQNRASAVAPTARSAPGGLLLPNRCNFTDEEPSVALGKILSSESKCDRVVDGTKVELCLYNGCEQVYVTMNVYSTAGTTCEDKGKYAIEYQFAASDGISSGAPVIRRHAEAIGSTTSVKPLAPPALNFAAAGLEEPEPHAMLDDLKHLNGMLRQVDQANSVRVHVVRAVAAMVAAPTPADCDAFIASGCFDVFCATIANAAALSASQLDAMFSPGAPERDICHSAIRTVAVACQTSPAALERAWSLGTVAHLVLLANSLRAQSHVRHRELLREAVSTINAMATSAANPERVRAVEGLRKFLTESADCTDARVETPLRSLRAIFA